MSGTDRGRKRSLEVTGGPAQAAARSMLRAMGWTTDDLKLPQAGVAASWNAVTPCNMHLDELALAAADELKSLRILPLVFHTISVSDGIAMGTEGMRCVTSLTRLDRRLGRARRPRRADGRPSSRSRAATRPSRHDAGDDPARPSGRVRVRRLDQAGCFRGKDVSIQDVYEGIGAHATGR